MWTGIGNKTPGHLRPETLESGTRVPTGFEDAVTGGEALKCLKVDAQSFQCKHVVFRTNITNRD